MTMGILLALALGATQPASEGERLTYVLGCVRCHHQTPRAIQKSPALTSVRRYSPEQFRDLMTRGVTRTGKDLAAEGKLMGVLAVEQYSLLTAEEIDAVYEFLSTGWDRSRENAEKAKVPGLWKQPY